MRVCSVAHAAADGQVTEQELGTASKNMVRKRVNSAFVADFLSVEQISGAKVGGNITSTTRIFFLH